MKNDSKITEKLPYAITLQLKTAQREDTPAGWFYFAGMLAMEITRNPCPELMTAHNAAMQNAKAAGRLCLHSHAPEPKKPAYRIDNARTTSRAKSSKSTGRVSHD